MKRRFYLVGSFLLLLLSHYIIALLGGNLLYRYFGYGLCTFIVLHLTLSKYQNLKYYYFLSIPILFNLFIATYSYYHYNTSFVPLGLVGLLSLIFAYFIFKKKHVKYYIFYLFILLCTTYIYSNWLYGKDYIIYNDTFSEKITVKDEYDNNIELNKQLNKVVVLDLWSSNCGICFEKFPEFEKYYKHYEDDTLVSLYSLYLPLKNDELSKVKKKVNNYEFKKLYVKELAAWDILNIDGVPLIMIIDKKGKIRYKGSFNTNKFMLYNNFSRLIEKLKNE